MVAHDPSKVEVRVRITRDALFVFISMLTLIEFTKIIKAIQEHDRFMSKLQNLHIDILEIPELFIISDICDVVFMSIFGETFTDRINEWIYEKNGLEASEDEIASFYNELSKDFYNYKNNERVSEI